MNKLTQTLSQVKQKPIGLMTHVVIGYPNLEETKNIVVTMAKNGADIIELQIPFSDPLADGPTIMKACEKALENGTKVADAFRLMQELSQQVLVPLLFMCYYNTVFNFGVEKFIREAKDAGCEGLIVPDMPIEEEQYEHFYGLCNKYNLPAIFVVSPATTNQRLQQIQRMANGFVYATARQGITGARSLLDNATIEFLQRVRKHIVIPIAVGFGISDKTHLQQLRGHADIAVVGSAIIHKITEKKGVSDFIRSLVIK